VNCQDAIRLLYDVVDQEADESDIGQVQEHLRKCRHCSARYELELKFKRCVEEKGTFSSDCNKLRTQIIDELDSLDNAAGEVGAFRPPFKWIAVGMAAAAAIILCLIAANALTDYYVLQTEILPFTRAHVANVEQDHPTPFHADPFEFLYAHTGIRMELPPQLSVDDIRTVMIDTIKGVQFGCIQLYGPNDDIISVFVTQDDLYSLPSEPCEFIKGSKMLVSGCKQCNLVGCEKRGLVYVAVSRNSSKPEHLAELTSYF